MISAVLFVVSKLLPVHAASGIIKAMQKTLKEKWRTIKDFPDYAVSNYGRIKRITKHNCNRYKNSLPTLKTHKQQGYNVVTLMRRDGTWTPKRVARLVCEAFNGAPPFERAQAAHLDGNRSNDIADNLQWKTSKQNNNDKWTHGTMQYGEAIANAKLTEHKVREIREERESKKTSWAKLAAKHNVSPRSIRDCCAKKTWAHVI